MKKLLALVLAAAALCGCTTRQQAPSLAESQDSGQAAAPLGRYVEESWSLPPVSEESYLLQLKATGGGYALGFSDNDIPRLFFSEDGKSWEERDAALLQAAASEDYWISGMDWDESGRYFLLCYNDAARRTIVLRGENGGWETLPINWSASGNDLFPQNLTLGPDGSLFFADGMESTYRYAADGSYIACYPVSFGTVLAEQIASYRDGSKEVAFFDLASGEEARRVPVDAAILSGDGWPLIEADGEDGLCFVSTGGLFRLAEGGSLFEQLIDGGACSLGKPSLSAVRCASGADGSFLVQLTDRENALTLLHYRYDPDIPAQAEKELTVATLTEQPTLRQAAVEYQTAHPETMVTLRVLWEEDSAMTKSDALRALNTELLAGSGPDVLALDGMPLQSYEKKGVLADLSETLSPLLEDGTLLQNIAGAYRQEDKLFAVPTRFTVPMLCVPPEHSDWESLTDIAQWARENPQRRVLYNLDPGALIRLFYPACFSAWSGADGQTDETALAEFLDCLQALAANDGGEHFPDDPALLFGGVLPANLDEQILEELKEALAPIRMAYGRTESFALQHAFTRFADLRLPYAALGVRLGREPLPEETVQYLLPLPGMGERSFTPSCILGANAAGKNRDLAIGFIETALSESVQSAGLSDGLAVHAAALAASVDTADNWVSSMRDPEGNQLMEEVTPVEAQQPLLPVFSSLTVPALIDETMFGFLLEEALPVFEGGRSAEEAAGAYAERVRAYLAE